MGSYHTNPGTFANSPVHYPFDATETQRSCVTLLFPPLLEIVGRTGLTSSSLKENNMYGSLEREAVVYSLIQIQRQPSTYIIIDRSSIP